MSFHGPLSELLPPDLPHRDRVIELSARHLELIVEANRQFNLTRITGGREAAIKHVVDSVLPWRLFVGAGHIADAGTGAGFPGIPLAIVLPEARFTLLESTQKKARFVESAVAALGLPNVQVLAERAEDWLKRNQPDILTARAVAPLSRALVLFAPAVRSGGRVLLYKGPDAANEIGDAAAEARKRQLRAEIRFRYHLPDDLGERTVVEIRRV